MMDNKALVIENLVKSYGEVTAVNDISFQVEKGSLFAFLGINGAGKSTTINIICSILSKDSGKIYVDGLDLDQDSFKIKSEIGIVFQNSVLDQDLTVLENLEIRTSFYNLSKEERKKNIQLIIDLLELEPLLKQSVRSLSGGQRRRVDIARAMVHQPKLLILDEPTTGLDPKTRLVVWSLINKIRQETGMTVFLTTHYLEEAEKASYVVIMDKGKIIASGTPVELKHHYSKDSILCYCEENNEFSEKLTNDHLTYYYLEEQHAYKILLDEPLLASDIIMKYAAYMKNIEVLKGTMDDVFLNVTGKNILLGEENEQQN